MTSSNLTGLSVLALAAVLVGCGYPKSAPVPAVPGGETSSNWPDAAEGRTLFVANCNKCHAHPDVHSESDAEWPSIVQRMAKKADLDAAQGEKVLHFVLAARSQH